MCIDGRLSELDFVSRDRVGKEAGADLEKVTVEILEV